MYTSLILDARTAGARLPRQLSALQRFARSHSNGIEVEVVVVDDSGDPRLPALAQRYDARFYPCDGTPLGDRLNTGVAHSRGEVLIFPAAATLMSDTWLRQLNWHTEQTQWDVAVLSSRRRGPLARLWRCLQRPSRSDTLCVSRCWFERIGGFDPALDQEALADLLERLRACQARVEVTLP